MKLHELTKIIPIPLDYREIEFYGVANNSQIVKPGDLFFAIKGYKTDGSKFLKEAIQKGAAAVLIEDGVTRSGFFNFPIIQVPQIRKVQGLVASYFFGEPSQKLRMIGITGTNGKTTVAHLIQYLLNFGGVSTGLIGTVWTNTGKDILYSMRTTPDAIELQKTLAEMVENGIKTVVMEVSSHALALERVSGIEFDVAVLTNITHDHFDFHHDYQQYLETKKKLFQNLNTGQKSVKYAVINRDDRSFPVIAEAIRNGIVSYGLSDTADVSVTDIITDGPYRQLTLKLCGTKCRLKTTLPGEFNLCNIMAAVTVGYRERILIEDIELALPEFPGVPGRYQRIDYGQPFSVMVDFAHNPSALENILKMAREQTEGRRILVFGCEGEKDRSKRPLMGQVAFSKAEIPILTSDNVYNEDLNQIFGDVLQGIPETERNTIIIEPDRKSAIRKAVELAEPGDFVIIAGKGHEKSLVVGNEKLHFDDAEVLKEILSDNPLGS